MVEAVGPYFDNIRAGELDVPIIERTESERPDPVRKADFWLEGENAKLDELVNEAEKLIDSHNSIWQAKGYADISRVADARRLLRRADCPDLTPKEQEYVEVQDELERFTSRLQTIKQSIEDKIGLDDVKVYDLRKERDYTEKQIRYYQEELLILAGDLRREKR